MIKDLEAAIGYHFHNISLVNHRIFLEHLAAYQKTERK